MRFINKNDRVAAGRTIYLHNGSKVVLEKGTKVEHLVAAAKRKGTEVYAIRSKKGGVVQVRVSSQEIPF